MLLNNFFKIIKSEKTDNKIISEIEISANHTIFTGHFPGNPITPGVVQIQIVKEILENIYQKELRLLTMPRCNFLKIWNPSDTPRIIIEISFSENPLHVSAVGLNNSDTYFKLSAVFSSEPVLKSY